MSRIMTIDGVTVLVAPNWSIPDRVNSRTTMQFTVVDMLLATEINIGDNISFVDGATTYFKGTVQDVEEYEVSPGELEYFVTGVDFNQLADKRLIVESYLGQSAGTIVTDFITQKLTEEGVTAGTIQTGPTISKAVFNYDKISTALDYIKDVTSYVWNIDFSKQLNFFERSTNAAPFTLDDNKQHYKFRRKRTRKEYRNKQYVRGGKGRTGTQTLEKPSPEPDGISRNFIFRFGLAEKPEIFVNGVQVSASDVGVNGIDSGKKWYFNFGSKAIVQDESETVLTSADALEITYIGLLETLTVADDATQIADRKNKESGTSGIYENMVTEKSINDNDAAIEFAQGLLVKYGRIPSIVTFKTEESGLQAGQLLPINKTLYGINDSFLIESVNTYLSGNNVVSYDVKCLDGSALGGWDEFFKEIIKSGRDYVIQENEVLIKLKTADDTVSCKDAFVVSKASPESRIGYAMIGYAEVN